MCNGFLKIVLFFFILTVLKGFVDRRKYQRLLENKKRQDQFVETYLECVAGLAQNSFAVLKSTAEHDKTRHSEKVQLRQNRPRHG